MNPSIPQTIIREVATLLLGAAFKGSVIFVVVLAASTALKRLHPRLRALLWLSAVASYLVVLGLSVAGPFGAVEISNPFRHAGLRSAFSTVVAPGQVFFAGASTAPNPERIGGAAISRAAAFAPSWALVAAAVWAAGVMLSSLRVIVGWVALAGLARSAVAAATGPQADLAAALCRSQGIRRRVQLLISPRCTIPFTWREARPVIMLPAEVGVWSRARLHAVLLHEVRHIAGHDAVARACVRAACAVFWFVPFIWVAGALFSMEQEKACDRETIEGGVEPRRYAACVLAIARFSGRPMAFESVSLAGQRKRVLEARIRSIVRGGRAMKKGGLVLAVALLVVAGLVAVSGASAQEKLTDEAAWKKFVGRWINMEYPGIQPKVQMVVLKPGFVGEDWLHPTDPAADGVWHANPKKAWSDRSGNTYLQFYCTYSTHFTDCGTPVSSARCLYRTDRTGTTMEATVTIGAEDGVYPEEINPEAKIEYFSFYFIYHRET